MRRLTLPLVVVCVLAAAPVALAQQGRDDGQTLRETIRRVVREVIRHILPSTLGDSLSPPKP